MRIKIKRTKQTKKHDQAAKKAGHLNNPVKAQTQTSIKTRPSLKKAPIQINKTTAHPTPVDTLPNNINLHIPKKITIINNTIADITNL